MTNASRLVLAGLFTVVSSQLFAPPSGGFLERRRLDRIETAENRWTAPERVTLNIHYRVPVVETLGYLAAFYPNDQKLVQITNELRPIATRVQDLAGDRFEGRTFPPTVDAECQKLRSEMFADVKAIYGQDAVTRIENYLELKYGTMTGGFLNEIID
ncbi:hypothetical protein [Cerasicoccus frondis]|uniref:hypothetical protein n=1 Tax=Cerasicoccus frondis TaxID=490090 RepID=UPI002852D07C|nr:hypothetical protein [Cerasicoccus frondis]